MQKFSSHLPKVEDFIIGPFREEIMHRKFIGNAFFHTFPAQVFLTAEDHV